MSETTALLNQGTDVIDCNAGHLVVEAEEKKLWVLKVQVKTDGENVTGALFIWRDANEMAFVLDNVADKFAVRIVYRLRPFEIRKHWTWAVA